MTFPEAARIVLEFSRKNIGRRATLTNACPPWTGEEHGDLSSAIEALHQFVRPSEKPSQYKLRVNMVVAQLRRMAVLPPSVDAMSADMRFHGAVVCQEALEIVADERTSRLRRDEEQVKNAASKRYTPATKTQRPMTLGGLKPRQLAINRVAARRSA